MNQTVHRATLAELVLVVVISCGLSYLIIQVGVASLVVPYLNIRFGGGYDPLVTFWRIFTRLPTIEAGVPLVVFSAFTALAAYTVQPASKIWRYFFVFAPIAGVVYVARRIIATASIPRRHFDDPPQVVRELIELNLYFILVHFTFFVISLWLIKSLFFKNRHFVKQILHLLTREHGG